MIFYWVKTSIFIKKIFFRHIWSIPNKEKAVYLTFDDGPSTEITEWVLAELKKHEAKATFFCIGNNIDKHPSIFSKILQEGHAIGNHTFNHLNGWKTDKTAYVQNAMQCAKAIEAFAYKSKLFRPPYGKIKPSQAKALRDKGYQVIMWDVLSADFDKQISPEQCLENVLRNVASGSIIVFHDSVKAYENLKYVLPKTLSFLAQNKYKSLKI